MERTRFQHHQGPFGIPDFPVSDHTVHLEPLENSGPLFDYEIAQHLHSDLVQVFFFDRGSGSMLTEGQEFEFHSPGIAFIPAGVLHGFHFPEDISGEVLTLATPLFESVLEGLPDLSLHFESLHILQFAGNEAAFEELRGTRGRFHGELEDDRPAREKIIRLLAQILVVRLYRVVVEHVSPNVTTDNRTLAYYNGMMRILKRNPVKMRTVSDCASQMGISPGHLNRLCRDLVGKSALQLIHEQVAREARARLLSSKESISEIAYSLEFGDPSHFSKFFRRMAGCSPRQYRRQRTT